MLVAVGIGAAAAVLVSVFTGGRTMLESAGRLPLATLGAVVGLDLVSWLGEAVVFASLAGKRGVRGLLAMVSAYVGGGFPALVTPFGSGGIPGWTWALTKEGLSPGEAAAVIGTRGLLTSVLFVVAGGVALGVVPARISSSPGVTVAGAGGLLLVLAVMITIVVKPRIASRLLQRIL
ncbi:MAG TPA: hypothetical protein VF902_03245, partial [Coriobacteriia bacterium]